MDEDEPTVAAVALAGGRETKGEVGADRLGDDLHPYALPLRGGEQGAPSAARVQAPQLFCAPAAIQSFSTFTWAPVSRG